MIVTEHWTTRSGCRTAGDIITAMDHMPCALLHGSGEWLIYGRNPVMVISSLDQRLEMKRTGVIPPLCPDLIGWITYEEGLKLDPAFPHSRETAIPGMRFVLFKTIELAHLPTNQTFLSHRDLPSLNLSVPLTTDPFKAQKTGDSESRTAYMNKVQSIRSEIASGNVYQANLTRTETWQTVGDDRLFAKRLAAANPAPFSAYIRMPDTTVISSSPERFLRLRDNMLTASPIKGTVPRGEDPTSDRELSRFLLQDPKNLSELAMITDLLRNDLSRVCTVGSVQVDGFPALESFANVHHLVAHITGSVTRSAGLADILTAAFPGGSITGCPRIAAIHLLDQLETVPRGLYTGSIGWLQADHTAFDLNIAIRTCTIIENALTFGWVVELYGIRIPPWSMMKQS